MTETTPPRLDGYARRRRKSRAALTGAAIDLFQSKGVGATTLEEICERADVSLRTFFNHFETREHLHEAIAHERATRLAGLLGAWAADPRPFDARLREMFSAIGTYLGERPAYREFVGEMLRLRPARGNEVVRSGVLARAMVDFVAAGARGGEVTRSRPPEVLADLLLGTITLALANWSADAGYDVEGELAASCDALADLLARPS